MFDLQGRHAVVTGGGKGIGAAVARALAGAGARVTLMGRDRSALDRVAMDVGGQPITVDLTVDSAAAQAFEDAQKLAGPVEILVNNVGSAESAPFDRTSREIWDRMVTVNMTVAFLCTQQVIKGMRSRSFGRIVNVASTASLKGYPYVAAYCAAKHGLLGLTKALAMETARQGITVNAVCPGFTETDLLARSVQTIVDATGRTQEQARDELLRGNPMGRFIQPEEVATAVLWLCSEEAGSVTGQAILVDGGEVG